MTTDIIMGIAGIAIGILTSYVFYEIQKRKKEACWSIDSTNLIKGYSSLLEKLDIQYAGQKVENLTVSKIAFWNNGNEIINHSDIAIPLYIAPLNNKEDTQILDVKILATSTLGNEFNATKLEGKNIVVMGFDYLDPQQGAVMQIIHTGVSVLPLIVDGEIKGVKEIIYKRKKRDFIDVMPRIFIYFYGLLSLAGFLVSYFNKSSKSSSLDTLTLTMWASLITFILVALLGFWDIKSSAKVAKIPKSLLVFDKDNGL